MKDLETIKKVLINTRGNFKEQAEKWRDNWQVTVPVYYILAFKMYRKGQFKL